MIGFREIKLSDAKKILDWRMSKKVSKFMNSEIFFDIKKQKEWILSCYNKKHYYHWIVTYKDYDIGYINIADLDYDKKKTSWGFYIGANNVLGIGSIIPLYFYNFCFNDLSLNLIYGQVFASNKNLIKMHYYHGYELNSAEDKYIVKNNEKILTKSLVLKRENFEKKNFSRYCAHFPVKKWKNFPKV